MAIELVIFVLFYTSVSKSFQLRQVFSVTNNFQDVLFCTQFCVEKEWHNEVGSPDHMHYIL